MNPNVYLAYLCFLDKVDGNINDNFLIWRKSALSVGFVVYQINQIAYAKYLKSQSDFIFEAEKLWKNTDFSSFISFLKKYGFKK